LAHCFAYVKDFQLSTFSLGEKIVYNCGHRIARPFPLFFCAVTNTPCPDALFSYKFSKLRGMSNIYSVFSHAHIHNSRFTLS
jgi:hypothetical protein